MQGLQYQELPGLPPQAWRKNVVVTREHVEVRRYNFLILLVHTDFRIKTFESVGGVKQISQVTRMVCHTRMKKQRTNYIKTQRDPFNDIYICLGGMHGWKMIRLMDEKYN